MRKEKIKASLNFFISFLSRDLETLKFDVNSISMELSVYEMRQEKFFSRLEWWVLRFDLADEIYPGIFVCLSSFVTDVVANVRASGILCYDDRK